MPLHGNVCLCAAVCYAHAADDDGSYLDEFVGDPLAEDDLPDLDFVIELPLFPEIDAELFVVLQHVTAVEHQLPQIMAAERQRLEATELEGVSDEYEYQAVRTWRC